MSADQIHDWVIDSLGPYGPFIATVEQLAKSQKRDIDMSAAYRWISEMPDDVYDAMTQAMSS